ncbi:hypothetical protein P4571_07870 [Niallia alba]|uniref:hypothetical protein n=1 Tax=Niallia alba TaxID=2729105 RepID=UPI002E1A9545|nr:hypothetical protein [Niallia alba]
MGGRPKPTWEEVVKLFEKRDYILLETEYVNSKVKMQYICRKHEEEGIQSIGYSNIKKGIGCKYCGREVTAEKQKLDFHVVKEAFEKDGYTLLENNYIKNNVPMSYSCPHHPEKSLKITYADRKNGKGCPYCANVVKYTIEEVKEIFGQSGYILLEKEYKNNRTHMQYICPHHPDKKLEMTLKSYVVKGSRCPYCSGVGRASFEQVKSAFNNSKFVLLEDEYKSLNSKMKCYCINHPEIIQFKTYHSIRKGHGCTYCKGLAKHRYEDVKAKFEDKNYTLISKEYKHNQSKLKYRCNIHSDKVRTISYHSLLAGHGCSDCAFDNSRMDFANVKSLFESKNYTLVSTAKDYKNCYSVLLYICKKHPEEIREITYDRVRDNHGCFECYMERNRGENHPKWNHDKTMEERIVDRSYPEYHRWRTDVFIRDSRTCRCCGSTKNIVAHHKDGYGWCRERRTDIENGVTLCSECHTDFHNIYGNLNNTEQQYNEWITRKRALN